ncbi:MAG: hypothetical protein PHU01_02585 [Desulfuromonadaceae bacterium]|nr:hypothetical protein [Desulfuromonadaceae bacterium]
MFKLFFLIAGAALLSPCSLYAYEGGYTDSKTMAKKSIPPIQRIAVVGVHNEAEEPELSKLLVVYGISRMVAQELYDTGQFVPVEDNPEISKRIQELVQLSISSGDQVKQSESLFDQLGSDAVADVIIKKFSKSRFRGFAGLFSTAKVNINVEVEVDVKTRSGIVVTGQGSGSGKTVSNGVLFEVRDDKIYFDKTSVGIAMHSAVKEAVQSVAARFMEVK